MTIIIIACTLIAGCQSTPPTPSPTPVATTQPTPIETSQTPTASITTPPPPPVKPSFDSYVASGYMGDVGDIHITDPYKGTAHSGTSSIQIVYDANGAGKNICDYPPPCKWSGIYWLSPASNWGDKAKGLDLTGYTKLTFWARGEKGGEKAEFKVGGVKKQQSFAYSDSIQDPATTNVIQLSKDWEQHAIDLKGKDLSHVIGGFAWVTTQSQNPDGATIYLDDIQFE